MHLSRRRVGCRVPLPRNPVTSHITVIKASALDFSGDHGLPVICALSKDRPAVRSAICGSPVVIDSGRIVHVTAFLPSNGVDEAQIVRIIGRGLLPTCGSSAGPNVRLARTSKSFCCMGSARGTM